MSKARYVGTWELIPELSLYAVGQMPSSGTYVIARDAPGTLALRVTWRMPGDTADRATQFGGPSDGSRVSLPTGAAGAPDAMTLTHVDDNTLDSAALRGADVVAYARRVVSGDGGLMSVVQEMTGADGHPVRNFQVYRRVQSTG